MQVQVVRHNSRAENADRDVKHLLVLDELEGWQQAVRGRGQVGLGLDQLEYETTGNGRDQCNDKRFQQTKSAMLQQQDKQYIQAGDQHADGNGNVEQQIQRDSGADD